jgi:hypothetical protein
MIDWSQWITLKEMACIVNRPYKTLHAYVLAKKLPAVKRNGTRWYVHKSIVEKFKKGALDVSGAFRK